MKYIFDDFIVDAALHELRSGDAPIAVEPKVFDVLLHLIENNERVISKDELIETVWNGRFISDAAVASAISAARKALGDDGKGQRYVKTVHGRGFRFVAPVVQATAEAPRDPESGQPEQDIRYCHSADGTRLAWATAGHGSPLVKTSHWLTHLEFDWDSPVWNHVNRDLMQNHRLIRFDARGHGLSEWQVGDFSFERQVEDLEAVVEAAGLDRFPILGMSQAAAVSVAYAVRHPERVTKLVLYGGYDCGWLHNASERSIEMTEAAITLMENGWGSPLAVQQIFSATFMPEAPPENQLWFSELQKKTTNGKNAARLLRAIGEVDIRPILSRVTVPTLVVHSRMDAAIRYDIGQRLAAGIPDARFVSLETSNHILPDTDPAWHRLARLIWDFLGE